MKSKEYDFVKSKPYGFQSFHEESSLNINEKTDRRECSNVEHGE